MNPYRGEDFFSFFRILLIRLGDRVAGGMGRGDMASDEVQIVTLCLIACTSACVGTFLVLRRMTMLANSLSHTILPGIVVMVLITKGVSHGASSYRMGTLLMTALITGVITTALTEWFCKGFHLRKDAGIGLIFTALFSLGIIGINLFLRHVHMGLETVTGNLDALHIDDVRLAFKVCVINCAIVIAFRKSYVLVTFDAAFARNCGISDLFFRYLLMVQTATTAISAFRALGVFLFLAFIVVLPEAARCFTKKIGSLIFCGCAIGCAVSTVSVALARHSLSVYAIPLSTAGMTTILLGLAFCVGIGYRSVLSYVRKRGVRLRIARAPERGMG